MAIEKDKKNQPVTIDVIPNESPVPQKSEAEPSKKTANSTQTQLLSLAKDFGIAGSLKPLEKQTPLEDRMLGRERINHLRKQENIEAIIEKSLKYCSDRAVGDKADPDWFTQFISLAEHISNSTMQDLWAKILAGEISQPGSFSFKALQAFRNLSLKDAKLLAKACSIAMKDKSNKNIRLLTGSYQLPSLFNILDKQREINVSLTQLGLGFAEIMSLVDNNLLYGQEAELAPMSKGEELHLKHNGTAVTLVAAKNNVVIKFYKFTSVGVELAQLIAEKPDEELLNTTKVALTHHFVAR